MVGLLTNAFNFLPIGRLDGGRVATSIAGRQAAETISFFTLLANGISFITSASPISFYFILIVVFLQRGAGIPPEDDVTPIVTEEEENKKGPLYFARAAALAFCIGLTATTIVPVPTNPPPPTNDMTIQRQGDNNLQGGGLFKSAPSSSSSSFPSPLSSDPIMSPSKINLDALNSIIPPIDT